MMKSYTEYKECTPIWLSPLPSNWDKIKLKFIAKRITKGTTPTTVGKEFVEKGINFIKVECISEYGTIILENCAFIDEDTHKLLERSQLKNGDLLISIAGAIGRMAIVENNVLPANTNQAVGIVRLKQNIVNNRWLLYCLNSETILQHYKLSIVETAQSNISLDDVGLTIIPFLDEIEQQKIANFLDQKTSLIDKFISNRKKQIELLEEKKAAIINKAVTRGINPNVKLKPSGILEIDEIPASWIMTKIKFLTKDKKGAIRTGPFGSQLKISDLVENGEIRVYNQRSVINDNFEDGEKFISTEKYNTLREFTIEFGDLLLTTRGTIGKCSIFPREAIKGVLHPCLIRIQLNETKIMKEYLRACIEYGQFFIEEIKLLSNSTVIDVIYSYNLKEVAIPTPPSIEEQKVILEFIKNEFNKIDSLKLKYQSQMDLIQEYKTALISEAVTGKIDVREWKKPINSILTRVVGNETKEN